ncbi:hypothetical protein EAF00_003859 [Botryotinia globosa]|nr:hypothetical protein EAF00_003859 [Botryotinia globosa]
MSFRGPFRVPMFPWRKLSRYRGPRNLDHRVWTSEMHISAESESEPWMIVLSAQCSATQFFDTIGL